MKRSIHLPSFFALLLVSILTGGGRWWLWQRSMASSGEIRCNTGGYSVMACDTDFGNYATALILVAAPLIAWLVHKAFFTKFKGGR